MTDKQIIFANEYLIDLNGTRAYKEAYPHVKNDNTAAAAATRLMNVPDVNEYIKENKRQTGKNRSYTGRCNTGTGSSWFCKCSGICKSSYQTDNDTNREWRLCSSIG